MYIARTSMPIQQCLRLEHKHSKTMIYSTACLFHCANHVKSGHLQELTLSSVPRIREVPLYIALSRLSMHIDQLCNYVCVHRCGLPATDDLEERPMYCFSCFWLCVSLSPSVLYSPWCLTCNYILFHVSCAARIRYI